MPSRPLTVLQVVPALHAGGVERGTVEVAGELVRRGHRSIVLSAGGRLVKQLEQEGSRHITRSVGAKSPLTLRHVGFVRNLLARGEIDIVHAASRIPAWVTLLARRKLPVSVRPRFVTSLHGLHSVSRFSSVMTRGEAVIAVSDTIRDYILENYSTPAERIRVIYRGVESAQFPRGFRPSDAWIHDFFQQFPRAQNQQLLTLPGRITRLKGHGDFARLIRKLVDSGHPVHGLIVGGEHPRKRRFGRELRQLVRDLKLEEHITMTGHRSDMKEVYAISDLVLSLSSKPESFGRTVLEALNLGTRVAGYAHGGVGEILGAVFNAGLIPPGNQMQLFDQVRQLLEPQAPEVRPVSQFLLADMLDQTVGLYEELCAGERQQQAA
ncbi:MAG: glycosyltransferase family 4 protein [Planctomycetaceae bacterium]